MPKPSRRHTIAVTVTFDKPVTKEMAVAAMNATMRGHEDYPPSPPMGYAPEYVKLGAFRMNTPRKK